MGPASYRRTPRKEDDMDKRNCLKGVLERLKMQIFFNTPNGVEEVSAIKSYQSDESYTHQVTLKNKTLGSYLSWGNNYSVVKGDGSSAFLEMDGENIVIVQKDYDRNYEGGFWKGSTTPQIICRVDDVVKMSFTTSSGWQGECYPERVYEKEDEGGERSYRESDWLVVLHRSTGSVTIERDFPFPLTS